MGVLRLRVSLVGVPMRARLSFADSKLRLVPFGEVMGGFFIVLRDGRLPAVLVLCHVSAILSRVAGDVGLRQIGDARAEQERAFLQGRASGPVSPLDGAGALVVDDRGRQRLGQRLDGVGGARSAEQENGFLHGSPRPVWPKCPITTAPRARRAPGQLETGVRLEERGGGQE